MNDFVFIVSAEALSTFGLILLGVLCFCLALIIGWVVFQEIISEDRASDPPIPPIIPTEQPRRRRYDRKDC